MTRVAILKATDAHILPKQPLQQALIEAFFDHLYNHYPIIEKEDVSGSEASVLVIQAVCMAGSLMRHGDAGAGLSLTHLLYEKVKMLIHLQYELNSMNVLKAMCLLSVWSPHPSNSLSLDSPWHWAGIATRLAVQMGLHKHSSYVDKPDAGCRQRVWWLLFVRALLLGRDQVS
jgi:Fungal specific transcription factor domain